MPKALISWIKSAAFVAGLVALPAAANAVTVTCPGDPVCNGNAYTATYSQVDADTWRIEIDVHVLGTYTGTLGSDKLSALAIKPDASWSNGSLYSAPVGAAFAFHDGGLNANGCQDNGNGFLCAGAGSNQGITLVKDSVLKFIFQFDAPTLGGLVHLKYDYIDSKGKKVGALGSFDMTMTETGEFNIPTPASAALLGAGLLVLGLTRSRRQPS